MSQKTTSSSGQKERKMPSENSIRPVFGSRRPLLLRNPSGAAAAAAAAAQLKASPVNSKKQTRVRSKLINAHSNPAGYAQQEKAYLRQIRNQQADDYYTKGIAGEGHGLLLDDDATDEDTNEIEDYDLEENSKRELLDLELDSDMARQLTGGEVMNTDDPTVRERMIWQNMLALVLTGEVVRSEKTKIGLQDLQFLQGTYKESLWYGIRAKLCGRTEEEQRKVVLYRRTLADLVIQEIMEFEVAYDGPDAFVQVEQVLKKWDLCCVNWRTWDEMKGEKLICRSKEFNDRLDALTSWYNIRNGLNAQIERIKQWIDTSTDIPQEPTLQTQTSHDSHQDYTSTDSNSNSAHTSYASTPTGELPVTKIMLPFINSSNEQLLSQKSRSLNGENLATVTELVNSLDVNDFALNETNLVEPFPTYNAPVPESRAKDSNLKLKPKLVVPDNSLQVPQREKNSTSPHPTITPLEHQDGISLAEQLMKKKDSQQIFYSRIFSPLFPWFIKAKVTYIRLLELFELLQLPDYIHDVIQLFLVPARLIKEIINVRLQYAMRLQNPTLMMIDQMIDDFKLYINIALEVKALIGEYCRPDTSNRWLVKEFFEQEELEFDTVVLDCVKYFLVLLNRKLLDSSRSPTTFRTFKEPEELEETWIYLRCLGVYFEGGSVVVAENITNLTSRLVHRLFAYLQHQINNPPTTPKTTSADINRWYSTTTENYGQLRRKLARFFVEISRDFSNSLTFDLSPVKVKSFLEILRDTGHFLVYTGSTESEGIYLFASRGLQGREQNIVKILKGEYIGTDGEVKLKYLNILREELSDLCPREYENEDSMYEYVLAICPAKPIVWDGQLFNLPNDDIILSDVKAGTVLLVAQHPHMLQQIKQSFLEVAAQIFRSPIGLRCLLLRVHHEISRINKAFFRSALFVLDSVQIVRAKAKEISPDADFLELINNSFIYARDYAKNALRHVDPKRRSTIVLKLIRLSINWVSFICDDCIPTDRKTFRWCVLALEFSMEMTKGFNIYILSEEEFYRLKLKVARCMSLLISHFDIMGARLLEAEKRRLLKLSQQRQNTEDDEDLIQMYHEEVLRDVQAIEDQRNNGDAPIGKVIDVTDREYQFVTLLALLFLLVTIRWQKGRFIGGGLFGLVYAAVNLDTGGVMAVKEIRFTDMQLVKNIVPMIRDEMTVLEILNHPNIVQYYGVEVHRDRVYIFMEYCEGGLLLNLLTHGRIEDEMVIQVYTLQMLEGLFYLHQSGVIHRDIKPENILLDHNGVIKYVDFGAAKMIANSGRTRTNTASSQGSSDGSNGAQNNGLGAPPVGSMTGTPMYMSPEVITGLATDRNGTVDIWSLGCCVLEMATGRRPWANLDNEWAIMYHIAAGHMPQLPLKDQLSEEGRNFLARCLEHDPKKRPSAGELLQDPWIDQIRQLAFDSQDSVATPSSEVAPDY